MSRHVHGFCFNTPFNSDRWSFVLKIQIQEKHRLPFTKSPSANPTNFHFYISINHKNFHFLTLQKCIALLWNSLDIRLVIIWKIEQFFPRSMLRFIVEIFLESASYLDCVVTLWRVFSRKSDLSVTFLVVVKADTKSTPC